MAGQAPEKQDANFVGFYIAREESLKKLPATPVFQTREPNSFTDFGAEYAKVARSPFNASRQRKKGTNSDLDVSGGWNEDVTATNMLQDLEAFTWSNAHSKGSEAVTGAVANDDHFVVASSAEFAAGDLIFASGFTKGANNGFHRVTGVGAGAVTVSTPLIDEAPAVGAPSKIEVAGFQFAAGDLTLDVEGGRAVLTSATVALDTFGVLPGEWIAVGGDGGNFAFDAGAFFARVAEVGEDAMYLDKTTIAITEADDGAAKTVQVFFGSFIRNEPNPDDIVRHTHVVERTLGKDADGIQSEFLRGFVFNEMTWNSPLSNKVAVDFTGIGLAYGKQTGAEKPLYKQDGVVVRKAPGEDPVNTSKNVYRIRMALLDPETLNPSPMFARCTEWTARIMNNVSAAKSQGSYGGFDTIVGQFDVSMTLSAYFSNVGNTESIDENDDITFDAIYSFDNRGIILDIPLISPGGGRLTIEQNAAIMLPLTGDGAESPFGHTIGFTIFPYLPNVLMATGA